MGRACQALVILVLTGAAGVPLARGQVTTSYVDDSVLARESLARVQDLLSTGSTSEAARIIQAVLDTETDRVVESPGDPEVFIGVRAAVHRELLARPALLERYRQSEEPVAQAMVHEGRLAEVERSRLLTRSGFEAALRLAQEQLEGARFEAARLTLEQLDVHPDRQDPRLGVLAATLAREIARYLPRESTRALAQRWAGEASLAAADAAPIEWPEGWMQSIGRDSASPGAAASLDAIVDGPLQSMSLSADASAEFRSYEESPRDDATTLALRAWTFPTIVGDTVLVNDGRAVTAFDRYTLSTLWREDFSESNPSDTSADPDDFFRNATTPLSIEDSCTIAAGEGVAVAALGILAQQQIREGDNRIHAYEISTGRTLWAVTPGAIADNLRLAVVRGPAVIDQSTAILTFRKESAARRLISTYQAGVDLWTGRTRWVRLIGSAGSVGSYGSRPGETPVAIEGVVYRADESGMISAIESATGRIRWIRVLKTTDIFAMQRDGSAPPWASQAPVIDRDSLIVLSPPPQSILRLSRESGAVLSQRAMGGLPLPIHYLLAAGPESARHLVAVSGNQMGLLPLASFDTAKASLVPAVAEPGFRGRIVAMGDTLVAPVSVGLLLAKTSAPRDPKLQPLDHTGNVVASGSNLLVADAWRLHSFLSWDDAQARLSARMKADPADPRPALALAELSYRSRHFDQLLPAADQALAALAAAPQSARTQQVKPRLFASLLEMVRTGTSPPSDAAPAPNPPSEKSPASPKSPAPARITDLALLDALIGRIERIAETPTENVEWLVSLAALREIQGNASDACQAYQRILEDSRLGDVLWRGTSPPVRGRALAVAGLRRIVGRFGIAAYARFAGELDTEIAALPPSPQAQQLESLAARYPVAAGSTKLWISAAAIHRSRGRAAAAAADLAEGSEIASWLVSVGVPPTQAMLGEAVGCQAESLAALGRPMTAAQVLLRSYRSQPSLVITCGGLPINPTARAAELREAAISSVRPPRLGAEPQPEIDVLLGWSLMPSVLDTGIATASVSHEWALMVNPAKQHFGAFADAGSGRLTPAWTRSFGGEPPTILRATVDAIYILWHEDTSVERIDPATGEAVWRSTPFTAAIPASPPVGVRVFDTPLDNSVRTIDIVAAIGDRSVILAQRDGATAVFDAAGGKLVWSARIPLTRVYDMALSGGTLVFSGASDPRDTVEGGPADRREPGAAPKPIVMAFDAGSGRLLYDLPSVDKDVRWIRASRDSLIVAQNDRLRGVELVSGKPLWPDIVGADVQNAAEGWIFDDTLYVLSPLRELHRVAMRTGESGRVDLHSIDRLGDGRTPMLAGRVGANIVFSSSSGVFMLGPDGALAGANTVSGRTPFMPALAGDRLLALVEGSANELPDGRSAIRVMLTSADSAKLARTLAVIVVDEPDTVAATLLDEKLILTTDAVTQVITLPPGDTAPNSRAAGSP